MQLRVERDLPKYLQSHGSAASAVMRRRLLTISAIRFGEMPMAFARRRIGRKSGLDALASVVESWLTYRFNLRRSSNRPSTPPPQ